jgi:hypothetical protein
MISLREHLPWETNEDKRVPLVLLTLHPGYAAGSYEDRDYFELLSPLLAGSHLILSDGDKMVNTLALRHAADEAKKKGADVVVHSINSSHSAEREDPQLVAERLHQIIVDMLDV